MIYNRDLFSASVIRKIASIILSIAVSCALISCGDSNRGTAPDLNIAPMALITMTPEVAIPGETVTLSGTSSTDADAKEGETLSYLWEQKSGANIELSSTDEQETSFVVPDKETTIVIQLVVTDAQGKPSSPATINIPVVIALVEETVFVSSTGGDDTSGDGSMASPLATIGRAIELAKKSGEATTIYVAPGKYNETVIMENNITLVGSVTGIDTDGNPVEADASSRTIIAAPSGVENVVTVNDSENVSLKGFEIEGSVSSGDCVDILVSGSKNVVLSSNVLTSRIGCETYTGISVENSENVKITSDGKKSVFNLVSGGADDDLMAIDAAQSDKLEVSNVKIQGGGNFSETTFVTAISVHDANEAVIKDNIVSISGTKQSTGILVKCEAVKATASMEHNQIQLSEAASKSSGISIICNQAESSFDVSRNLIVVKTKPNRLATIRGVETSIPTHDGTLSVVNNVISMPAATELVDSADKTAVHLSKFGSGSDIELLHNTLLVTGNMGLLYGISSDMGNVSFTAKGNTALIYGSNASNAVFSLMSACGISNCVSPSTANLMNGKVTNKDVAYIYYSDTMTKVAMSLVPTGNFVENTMKPAYFDMENGELLLERQSLAVNRGTASAEVTIDINGKTRDSMPDVGAIEY